MKRVIRMKARVAAGALLVALATLCMAATESRVSRASILAVERSINDKFRSSVTDPYDLLGTARGTYLEGYGTLFTIELDLVNASPLAFGPFKATMSPEEISATRDRKLKKVPVLKDTLRNLMANAGTTLEGLPGDEHIAMEAILWNYTWENSRGLPYRVFMTAEKQKLLAARAAHADLASVIEEQER